MLARHFIARGDEPVVVSRTPRGNSPWRVIGYDAMAAEVDGADGADGVINLAGRSVDCRYDAANRRLIRDSRVESVRAVAEAIRKASRPPRAWLQMSTATIYRHTLDRDQDEATGTLGVADDEPDTWHFSYGVAKAWETATNEADVPAETRRVLLRSAMVMNPDAGSVFAVLSRLCRLGLGGPVAGGRQTVSWVHDADLCGIIDFLIQRDDLAGPVNVASPNPLPYGEFMRVLRRAWGQPIGLPATRLMVEIGTRVMRTESELVLKSRRVVPGRLREAGYEFKFPDWPAAAADLVRRHREGSRGAAEGASRPAAA